MKTLLSIAVLTLAVTESSAQQGPIVPSFPGYVAVINPGPAAGLCGARGCITPDVGIPLSYFATPADVGRARKEALNMAAIAGAVQDAVPNPGDRFGFRIGAAGSSGVFAGAVGFSFNMNDSARLSLNYGHSGSIGLFSGGLNLSFK